MVAPRPPVQYQAIDRVEASYCGKFTAHRRFQRAYAAALAQAPGARSLVGVEVRETWNWGWLGVERCATVRGTAIR